MGAEVSTETAARVDFTNSNAKDKAFTSYVMPSLPGSIATESKTPETAPPFGFSYPKSFSTTSKAVTSDVLPSLSAPTDKEVQDPILEFHDFPKFPPEIRSMIWEWSIPGPRIIDMNGFYKLHQGTSFVCGYVNRSRQAPAILHVCSESRKFGQVIYVLQSYCYGDGCAQIYIDILRDTIFFRQLYTSYQRPWMYNPVMLDFGKIHHIAFGWRDYSFLEDLLFSRPSAILKTVTIVRDIYDMEGGPNRRKLEKEIIKGWKSSLTPAARKKDLKFRWMSYHENLGLVPSHYCTWDCTMDYNECFLEYSDYLVKVVEKFQKRNEKRKKLKKYNEKLQKYCEKKIFRPLMEQPSDGEQKESDNMRPAVYGYEFVDDNRIDWLLAGSEEAGDDEVHVKEVKKAENRVKEEAGIENGQNLGQNDENEEGRVKVKDDSIENIKGKASSGRYENGTNEANEANENRDDDDDVDSDILDRLFDDSSDDNDYFVDGFGGVLSSNIIDDEEDYFDDENDFEGDSFPNPRLHVDISAYKQRVNQAKKQERIRERNRLIIRQGILDKSSASASI